MSLSHLATTPITLAYSSNNPLRQRTTNSSRIQPVHHHVTKRVTHISCEQKKQSPDQKSDPNVIIDRRNMLLGLGGIYGATTTMGNQAVGEPLKPPDLSKCHLATDHESKKKVNCCPPYTTANIIDFKPPSSKEPLRVRKPAHKYNSDDIAKFEEAIARMKALPDDDPWSYKQQSTIHCTFCNDAFYQLGTEAQLQVHYSWIFHPWHRYYIYFWERILGKLIGDPTFAIPFWNYDTPKGMYIPKMYLNEQSPLFDDTRDKNHYSSVLDFMYAYPPEPNPNPDCPHNPDNPNPNPNPDFPDYPDYPNPNPNPSTPSQIDEVIMSNLCQIDRIFKETKLLPSLFMGKPVRAGQTVTTATMGANETLHNVMHQWVGPPICPYHNMGNFYTTARDPIFYGLHGNVDRLWDLYSGFRGNKPEFRDSDWLNSEFIFYDENRQVVKVKVKDCLQPEQLRYTYTQEELPWKDIGRKCKKLKAGKLGNTRSAGDSIKLVPVSEFGSSPRTLNQTIQVLVPRPTKSRSKTDKEDALEVLLIKGVEVAHGTAARFDVYITKPIEGLVGPDHGEFAGSFVKIPHSDHLHTDHSHKSSLEFGITALLEDIEAEDSEKLVVTLVPRNGNVTIDGVDVELFLVDDED